MVPSSSAAAVPAVASVAPARAVRERATARIRLMSRLCPIRPDRSVRSITDPIRDYAPALRGTLLMGREVHRREAAVAVASRTESGGVAAGAGRTARRGMWGLARLVGLITSLVVAVLVIGILLVGLGANQSNDIVSALLDAARFLAGPLDDVFKLDSHKATVAVNWGLAALVYALIGGLIARLLRR